MITIEIVKPVETKNFGIAGKQLTCYLKGVLISDYFEGTNPYPKMERAFRSACTSMVGVAR